MGTNLTRLMTILMKLLAEFIIWKMGENENMCNLYLSHYFIILFIFFFNEILPELCWRSFSNSPYLRAETSDTVCLGYVRNTREIYSLTYLFFHLFYSFYFFIYSSIYLFIYIFIHLFIYLFIYYWFTWFIYVFIYLIIYLVS